MFRLHVPTSKNGRLWYAISKYFFLEKPGRRSTFLIVSSLFKCLFIIVMRAKA